MTGIERLREFTNNECCPPIEHCTDRPCVRCEASCLQEIADQIERETERTCRMTQMGPEFILSGWWQCSECGIVYPPCNEEIARWALQYCPRCGAKVVEE